MKPQEKSMRTLMTKRTAVLALGLAVLALAAPALGAQGTAPAPKPQANRGPDEADKLHVVLLVFGHKGGISAACQKDCKGLKAALEAAFADDAHRLVIHDLTVKNPKTGKVYSSAETLAVIESLNPGGNDNVLVFQSGHGSIGDRNSPELSQRLMMDGGSLTRAQIQRPLEARKPRGIIFLTDCCSGFTKKQGAPKATGFVSAAAPNLQTIRNLMLRARGVVSITAAEDGKLASASYRGANPGKAGSAFTVAMLRLWFAGETYTSWEQFFPALKKETGLASGGRHSARAFRLPDGGTAVVAALNVRTPFAVPAFPFRPWR
jgi:hypothetical protein